MATAVKRTPPPSRSRGILMILSPAKTMDLSAMITKNVPPLSNADCDTAQTAQVAAAMQAMSQSQLRQLLQVQGALADTTCQHWQAFDAVHVPNDAKPAVFAFAGPAFQAIDAAHLDPAALAYLQENLRILDATYGVLRPLDRMQPCRLEMNTKNVVGSQKMTIFWKDAITNRLRQDLRRRAATTQTSPPTPAAAAPILLNLASEEYSAAVDWAALARDDNHVQVVQAVFTVQGRVTSGHAKRARGLMARYVATHQCQTVLDLRQFDLDGYRYMASKSSATTLVFDRGSGHAASSNRGRRAAKRPGVMDDKKPAAAQKRAR